MVTSGIQALAHSPVVQQRQVKTGLLGLERLLRASSDFQRLLGGQHRHGDQRVTGTAVGGYGALVTQVALLEKVGNDMWSQKTAEDGAGATVAELVEALRTSLRAYGLGDVQIEVLHPDDGSPATLERVRHLLSANEQSSQDVVLAYFNQGVLTGDWYGPHISPIGAYDAQRHQVLIFDVDRQWYVPYWSGDDKLLAALLRPAPAEHGVLAGQTGSLIRVYRARTP